MSASVTKPGTIEQSQKVQKRVRKVPEYLVRETIDGVPFYYRGYKEVLNNKAKLEDIMGDSGLQSLIKAYLYDILVQTLGREKYRHFIGETGTHLGLNNNLALDVSVFEKSALPGSRIDFKYLDTAPMLAVEVDMKATLEETGLQMFEEFLQLKTQKLFDFGTKRLIWVLTRSRKVVIAAPNEDWKIVDWNKDIQIWAGVIINIAGHLEAEGISPEIIFPPK